MFRLRSRWVRLGIFLILLLLVGLATYAIATSVWTSKQLAAAREALDRFDYTEAAECLERYLAARPTDGEGWLLAAQAARRRGRFHEATLRLTEADKHGASTKALETEQVLLATQAGDLTHADGLTRLCAGNPGHPEAALALEALIEGGLRADNLLVAERAVDLWLKHRPGQIDQAQGLVWRGRVNEHALNFSRGLADFLRAVELAPDHVPSRIWLADALIRSDPQQAVPHLDWLLRRRPADPDILLRAARLSRTLGQPEEAARLLDEVLAAAPHRILALLERGRVAMDLDRPAEAEERLRLAFRVAPEDREVNLALADCLRQAGRTDEAKYFQDKVEEIDQKRRMADAANRSSKQSSP